jgi:Cu(I)/Ag(I) efflux system protein CusF
MHSKHSIFPALLCTLLAFSAPAFAMSHEHGGGHDAQQPAMRRTDAIYSASGVVAAIDRTGGKINIQHGPIPALNWPGMTMNFELENPALLDGVSEGDQVDFIFRARSQAYVIIALEKL